MRRVRRLSKKQIALVNAELHRMRMEWRKRRIALGAPAEDGFWDKLDAGDPDAVKQFQEAFQTNWTEEIAEELLMPPKKRGARKQ